MIVPSKELRALHSHFTTSGFNLWFVGGCVRDTILGLEPKDIDLCTDATPEEQIELYKANKVRYFETGIKHGTITVSLRGHKVIQFYEITSLRTESEHDGRHAVVTYTRDLNEDLSRRDLTINAMAQDFDGNIIDPFNGMSDLRNERVRMVGDAEERFKEDYLRILRFYRFHARFAGLRPLDIEAADAVSKTKDNLVNISGERIWQEMQKILVGPRSGVTIHRMKNRGVMRAIQCKNVSAIHTLQCENMLLTRAPIVLGLSLMNSELEETMARWKMSNNERAEARFANKNRRNMNRESYKEQLVDGADIQWVEQLLLFHQLDSLSDWDIPVFPIDGLDLIAKGIKSGPALGLALRSLRQRWKDSNYTLTKEQLLKGAP